MSELIQVEHLTTCFSNYGKTVKAVDNISFSVHMHETLAIVGESGSGKSVTSLSIMRLVPNPPGQITDGKIIFGEQDLLTLPERKMQEIRGNKISMIFQEPMTSLNPVHRVGDQIAEAIMLHQKMDKQAAWQKTVQLLQSIGIPAPEERARDYPHQLSGGMRQRVMIAMALSCHPDLLIADEPTTALDVTIQAQILDLMRKMREDLGMGIILITHDMGVVAEMAHRVLVMYAGRIVEESPVNPLFSNPLHPYSVGLLRSIPKMDGNRERLYMIEGNIPELSKLPSGCAFSPRCPDAGSRCHQTPPMLKEYGEDRRVACWLHCPEGVEL